MGKKQKNIHKQASSQSKRELIETEQVKVKECQPIAKMSKSERRKLKKQQHKASNLAQNHSLHNQESQKDQHKQQTVIEVEASQSQLECLEESESLISINSSQIQDNFGNEIDLNPQGNQGFQDLIEEENQQSSNQVNSILIKRFNPSQVEEPFHFFHLKKQTFYKVTSLHHEKLNLTHLNQNATLRIIDQNLLKYANQQDPSSLFWLNGKIVHKQISFIKSTVFRVMQNTSQAPVKEQTKNQTKDKKKGSFQNMNQKIRENIEKFIRPTSPEHTSELVQFLRDFDWKQDCLLMSKQNLEISETSAPFQNIDQKIVSSNNSLMILGKKNTGKSTLAEYLKNTHPFSVCILDCDIGRSLSISGCVSLLTEKDHINLWIGEFTPFNCIQKYVAAIRRLYQVYREKHFSKKLVINTMGYLSGLGEMIVYEIYNLINPSELIVVKSPHEESSLGYDNIGNILKNIKTGVYLNKLVTLSSEDLKTQLRHFIQKKVNLNVQYLNNEHAQSKGIPIRFENLLMPKKNFKSIIELIKAIKSGQFQKVSNLPLLKQDKLGNVTQVDLTEPNQSDMRIVLIGAWIPEISESDTKNDPELFRVFGLGYGLEGSIYFSREQIESVLSPNIDLKHEPTQLRGLLSEGIDFEKNFYLVNELSLIDLELEYGQIPFMLPIIKGMGSKGVRNNPSKNA